jgi:tRNA U34 5-methylaminomethyl-2-thiouridine-forming methyltransferase MnmC
MKMAPEFNNLILTEDGSITCRDQESGELYHNRAGAYSEALQHYVQVCDLESRLKRQNKISVLDVCFGLGYNTFVFLDKLTELIRQGNLDQEVVLCNITGIDKDPEILDVLVDVLDDPRFEKLCRILNLNDQTIKQMIADWKAGEKCKLQFSDKVKIEIEIEIKIKDLRKAIPDLVSSRIHFDYVFHDGFSPRSMPELWTADLFREYTKILNPHGRIITYSSASAVRGGLKECGLEIRKSAPLGGKSGGTIAFRPASAEIADGISILHLSDDENRRLNSRSAIPYRDPNFNSTRAQILQRRAIEIEQSALPVYMP